MSTIEDVARRAGVSRSTVSYALSGKRTISRETRERIETAIAELRFTPNAGARALATSQTMVIGLFVQFFEDEFSPAMLQYVLPISDAAREAGYDILMITEDNGPKALERLSSSEMVDGVILLNVAYDDQRLPVMRKMRQPGSMVGLPREPDGFDVFDLDFAASGRLLMDHLAQRGHREVILITPREHVFERGGAYAWRFRDSALQQAATYGIRVHSFFGETQQPAVNRQLNEILDAQLGSAMIIHNDAMIAALPSVLYSRGIRVPDDLSVVGIFSEDFGRIFSLPFTAVETSPDKLGRNAVQALVRRMLDPKDAEAPTLEFIAPTIMDRGSTR
ncbi:MAG TPA: LacI family DNA-binding transcriptional regulator [Lacisediminihabitans sp.]|uniref:LacI family DNA-binding transcriptional regulator n=1 Tax=Lacisediminihabitans sp. TaxID=2787631 RepID=UPI002EDA1C0D